MIKKAMTKPPVTNIDKKHGTSSENDFVDIKKRRLEEDDDLPKLASFFSATVGPRHIMMFLLTNEATAGRNGRH
jgi:hypothetical protein